MSLTIRVFLSIAIVVALWTAHRLGVAMGVPDEVALPERPFEDFPMQFGLWHGEEIPTDDRFRGVATHMVQRLYRSPAQQPVLLYSTVSDRYDIPVAPHSPESCYPAGGYRITATSDVQVAAGAGGTFAARLLTVERDRSRRLVLFWFQIPGTTYLDGLQQRELLWGYRGKEKLPAIVKIMLETDADAPGALAALRDFAPPVHAWVAKYQGE